ncbi:hypothetical protein GCM10025883_25380 [Mobilicoccus caccae]|uniref:ATP-binding protein n=1 Tax=Mobilicoccus caccae TaxID=1859295 RepID=A0ABQ6IRE4_9MICO|nr:hypothetical protein GCM10025883_25380 [Mobilicoccus caccae]
MNRDFIVTKEHRRFTEFAGAIRKDVTIGICHGEAGVGKTQSARRYAHWDTLEPFIQAWGPRSVWFPRIVEGFGLRGVRDGRCGGLLVVDR